MPIVLSNRLVTKHKAFICPIDCIFRVSHFERRVFYAARRWNLNV